MPIHGLSEKRRLPRLGKIRTGIKRSKEVNGKTVEYPSAVDYFVLPEDNQYYAELVKVFGDKPRELRILIPVEDEERWCSQYYRAYSQSRGLICKGDGDTAIRMIDIRTGALADRNTVEAVLKEVSCPGRDCPDYEQSCREIMNLQFLLPEVPGLGVWQIDTSSINSIRNINSAADLVKRIYGRIAMIPLLLTLEPQEVQDSEGKRRTVNILNLRTNRTLLEMMETISKPAPQMLAPGDVQLPEPDDEVPEMIIPQVQEEKVTREVASEAVKTKRKAKISTEEPAPKTSSRDPEATQDEKKEIVQALKARGKSNEQIRDIFYSVTGKKGTWLRSDIEKLRATLSNEEKSPEEEADDFLKEIGG
ncbi:MAG: hypothetical protein PHU23_15965 [Dehalococcoidales bacterium]|nr:hypothetical protein [Dehalococcoidales bacterium]